MALNLVLKLGSVSDAAIQLDMPRGTLHTWAVQDPRWRNRKPGFAQPAEAGETRDWAKELQEAQDELTERSRDLDLATAEVAKLRVREQQAFQVDPGSVANETAVLTITDPHYGKGTATYDPDIFKLRLDGVRDKVAKIWELHRGHHVFDKLVIPILGDVNDGSGIFPTQGLHQVITDPNRQAREVARHLGAFARDMRDIWGVVELECVPGNHGRTGKFGHEAANWDMVAYQYLQMQVENDGIPVRMNERGNPFLRTIDIRGHKFLLYHGHEIRSWGSIPWYGILLRLSRWLMTEEFRDVKVVLMGHFHTKGRWQFNRVEALVSGTMVTDDEWAKQVFGWESATKWWMFGVSDSRPISWAYDIELADDKAVNPDYGLVMPTSTGIHAEFPRGRH